MARKQSIIIEGPDSSGKSTLATKLGLYYGMYVFRAGPKPVGYQHALICMTYQNSWITRTSCIWDRLTAISNQCNLPKPSFPAQKNYDLAIKTIRQYGIIVMCTAQNLEAHKLESYETEEDFIGVKEEHTIVTNNYIKFAYDTPGVLTYDFKVKSFDSLIEEINHALSINI